ncbi:MAG: glycosyltransferase family 2 protein, partial [Pseudomonadota bacterium]
LQSLHELTETPGRIVVVDNASTDNSADRIRTAYPEIEFVQNSQNLGYGRGQNATIKALIERGFDWIWLLNNDARAEPDSLRRMLDHAQQHADAGAIGAPIFDLDQTARLQAWGGGKINRWLGRSVQFQQPVDDRRLDYLTGASLLLRSAALQQAGLFDPAFFMYWEDVDLSIRLVDKGWSLSVAKQARVRHRGSASMVGQTARKDQLMNESAVRFFRKHGPLGGWPAIVIGITGRVGKRMFKGRWTQALAVLRGASNALRD